MDGMDEYRDGYGPIYGRRLEPTYAQPKFPHFRIWVQVVTNLLMWALLAAPVAYVAVVMAQRGEANPVGLLVAALPLSVFGAFAAFRRGHKAVGWFARLSAVAGLLVIAFFALIGWAMYQAGSP
jgi:hypothetical protein